MCAQDLAGIAILIAWMVPGWWFGRLNWKVYFHPELYPRLAPLLFPRAYRRGVMGTDVGSTLISWEFRRVEKHVEHEVLSSQFERYSYAMEGYCMTMCVIWVFKMIWNSILLSSYRVYDLVTAD
jgi:hypothetical protein